MHPTRKKTVLDTKRIIGVVSRFSIANLGISPRFSKRTSLMGLRDRQEKRSLLSPCRVLKRALLGDRALRLPHGRQRTVT